MAIQSELRYYLKLKALYLMYEKGYTNTQIAKELGISRVTLNHFLEEAKAEGMIKIEIVDTRNVKRFLEIENSIKTAYGLYDVKIIDSSAICINLRDYLANESARYIEMYLHSKMKIGLAWGRALSSMLKALTPNNSIKDIEVFTLLGGASSAVDLQPNIIAQSMLTNYSGTSHVITAPYLCHSELLCSELKKEPDIKQILSCVSELDLAIVGIGESPNSASFRTGYYGFSDDVVDELISVGAVGDICGNFFDANGHSCQTSITSRIVSADLNELSRCHKVIGIAYGTEKVDSIKGALKGNLIDVLITDSSAAEQLLENL